MNDIATPTFADRIRETMDRLNLDESGSAIYFGVPVFTLRKWVTGERKPGAAVVRLLDVLGTIEALAPAIHAGFLPAESMHVRKSRLSRVTESTHEPDMSENPD